MSTIQYSDMVAVGGWRPDSAWLDCPNLECPCLKKDGTGYGGLLGPISAGEKIDLTCPWCKTPLVTTAEKLKLPGWSDEEIHARMRAKGIEPK